MTKTTWFKAAVLVSMLAMTMVAMASEGIAGVTVLSPVQVNGTKLSAGDYKVSWSGTDNNVQVTFKQGKNDVATASAKVVERATAAPRTAVVNESGSLKELQFGGKKTTLVFNQ